ncbi:hypothetical protein BACERE00221_02503 [Bacillus paranthracis]|uniref:Uncharacterized protein n=1 Tax=Bacillus paranthracis TaxID=2026186 RepID=A0A9X8SEE9_9BACI|nr:hypothetical protein BACERE00221_02503 [Bacillus paranthracis]
MIFFDIDGTLHEVLTIIKKNDRVPPQSSFFVLRCDPSFVSWIFTPLL